MSIGKKHLVLKGRTWWFHRDIPAALRDAFDGRKTITKSLHTGDIRIAQQRRTELLLQTETEFREARGGTLTRQHDAVTEKAKTWAAERKEYEADPVAWSSKVSLGRPTETILAGGGEEVEFPSFSPDDFYREDAEKILKEHGRDAYERFMAIVHGDDPITAYIDDHLKSVALPARTAQERRTAVRRVAEWRPKLTLRTVTRRVAGEYVKALEDARTHPSTGNKALSNIRVYWKWLVRRGLAEENPWTDQSMDSRAAKRTSAKEREFTEDEIRRLLYAPYPTGWAHEQRLHDAMRIAALSGMRIEEICRLTVADCKGGLFNIREAKTKSGVRKVPIHWDLNDIVAMRTKGKDANAFLFDDIDKKGTTGERSMPLSKQFTRYRRALGVDPRGAEGQHRALVNFHSFRRWFVTMAERAGQPPHVIEAVVGHARTGMTLGTYSGGPSVEDQMAAVVEAVRLPTAPAPTPDNVP